MNDVVLICLLTAVGLGVGVFVNLIADYLPAQRHYDLARHSPFTTVKPIKPTFFPRRTDLRDGQASPWWTWSGLLSLTRPSVFDPPRRWRRLLVELGTALGFIAITAAYRTDPHLGYLLSYWPCLILITVIDLEHRWVMPETIALPAIIAIIEYLVVPRYPFETVVTGVLLSGGVALAAYLCGFIFGFAMQMLTGKRIGRTIFGLGDVYIATLCGLLIGATATPAMLILTAFFGGVSAVIFIVSRRFLGRKYRRFSALPYGPYFCAATALMLYVPSIGGVLLLRLFLS